MIVTQVSVDKKTYLVIEGPPHVLEVAVVQKHVGVLLHPGPDLCHTDGADLWLGIPEIKHL